MYQVSSIMIHYFEVYQYHKSLIIVYWVLAAKRQYNIKQTSNHKIYTDKPTKLLIELLIIRKSKANKKILNLFVLANNWGSFTERRGRLVTVSSHFASNRWRRQWPWLFVICLNSFLDCQSRLSARFCNRSNVQLSVYVPSPVIIWQVRRWSTSRVFVWSAVRLYARLGLHILALV